MSDEKSDHETWPVDIDSGLHEKLEAEAKIRGMTVRRLIEEILRKALEGPPKDGWTD